MTLRPPLDTCLYCDSIEVQWHHPTGVDIDPKYVVPLCHDHHRGVEDDWHTAGAGAKTEPLSALHGLQLGLQRWAMLVGRLARAGLCSDLLNPLARWLAEKAALIAWVIERLTCRYGPHWSSALET